MSNEIRESEIGPVFAYSTEKTFQQNFTEWRTLNQQERDIFNEEQLSESDALELFQKLFGQYK
jgi:hypothetical protein